MSTGSCIIASGENDKTSDHRNLVRGNLHDGRDAGIILEVACCSALVEMVVSGSAFKVVASHYPQPFHRPYSLTNMKNGDSRGNRTLL